jgi:hypothetical protein
LSRYYSTTNQQAADARAQANIIVVERAKPHAHVGFSEYVRLGLPLTVLTLAWGMVWLSVAQEFG